MLLKRLCIFICIVSLCTSNPVPAIHHCEAGELPCGDLTDKCVAKGNFCDGIHQCPNGFDEETCVDDIPTLEEYLEMEHLFCGVGEFKCSNGKCISLDLVCNGASDCKHGDDESPLCGNCDGFGCGASCRNLPTGPQCYCGPDTFLSVDGKTCEHEERCVVGNHKYSTNGVCVFDVDTEGPVRTSAPHMETMCAEKTACHNGGTCLEKEHSDDSTPVCNCPPGFNGLYCEIKWSDEVEESSSWLLTLFVLFVIVVIAIAVAVSVLRMYPNMRHKFESFSNINVSPRIDRIRNSRNGVAFIRAKDNASAPILSRSPSANFSPSSSTAGLLRSGEQSAQPIQISNSFTNPTFLTHSASQQRMDERALERDIQMNCATTMDHK